MLWDLNWRGEWADLKEGMSDYSSYYEQTLNKSFSQSFRSFLCNMLFTLIKQINKQILYNIQLSLPKQTKPTGSPNLPIQLIQLKVHNLKKTEFLTFFQLSDPLCWLLPTYLIRALLASTESSQRKWGVKMTFSTKTCSYTCTFTLSVEIITQLCSYLFHNLS